jgi:sigma-B regulation protein RsbU (phosphoserine phosphatase)
MMLYAFNDPLKNIFSNRPEEHLLYKRCGEAIGCAFSVEEMKECGKTSKCTTCELRESALLAYVNRKNVYKGKLAREFYKTDSTKALKYLQFSTRAFYYNQEYYLILIINDITPLTELYDSF